LAVRREEAGDNPGEEAGLPQPAPTDGHILTAPGQRQEQRIVAGAASGGIRGMHHAVARGSSSAGEKTSLAVWERSAARHTAPALPRSPPGRPGRVVFESR
jgi:hypothetical protein